jgi:hypothetical protein
MTPRYADSLLGLDLAGEWRAVMTASHDMENLALHHGGLCRLEEPATAGGIRAFMDGKPHFSGETRPVRRFLILFEIMQPMVPDRRLFI